MSYSAERLSSVCCPRCKSIEFRSVGVRNKLESMLQWLVQPYRCGLCGHHFFLFRWQAPAYTVG